MTNRSTNYCLTIFNLDLIPQLQHKYIKYSAYSHEICPTTNKPHLQAFVVFKHKLSPKQVLEIFPLQHHAIMRGSFLSNEIYCSKEGNLIEYGTKPMSQEDKGLKGKEYWDEQVKLAIQDPKLCDSKLQCTHIRNLQIIHQINKKRKFPQLDILTNEWFIGDTQTGKSSTARKENPDAYIKQCNKWWNDYDNEEVVIIDDIDLTHEYMAYNINQWADHYEFPAETKGGQMKIRPTKIIITSRYTPDQIFKDVSTIASINRRFTFRHFPQPAPTLPPL